MKILISGGSGFLGGAIINKLGVNNKFIILGRTNSNYSRLENLDHVFYNIDECNISKIYKKEKPDLVINTASNYGRANESFTQVVKSNVIYGLELYENAVNHNVKVFLNIDTFLDRNLNIYSLSKAQFRDWLRINKSNTHVINLRVEHIYGPDHDTNKFTGWLLNKMLYEDEIIELTSGEQKRDFIFIDDLIDLIGILLNQYSPNKPYLEMDVGSGHLVTMREFIEKLASMVERETNKNILDRLGFGKVPYRINECMHPLLDYSKTKEMGWESKTTLDLGLETIVNQILLK